MSRVSVRPGWRSRPVGTRGSAVGAIRRIADQLGVHPEALRTWVRRPRPMPAVTSNDAERLTGGDSVSGVAAGCRLGRGLLDRWVTRQAVGRRWLRRRERLGPATVADDIAA
jgi:transposase-like protein